MKTFEYMVRNKDADLYLPRTESTRPNEIHIKLSENAGFVQELVYTKEGDSLNIEFRNTPKEEFEIIISSEFELATSNTKIKEGVQRFKSDAKAGKTIIDLSQIVKQETKLTRS